MSLFVLNSSSSIKEKGIDELISFIETNDLEWIYIIILLVYGLSITISWFLGTKKNRVEIEKLKLENSSLKIDITEKCKTTRKIYYEKSENIQVLLRLMIHYMQETDVERAKETREDLKQTLTIELVPSFIDYLEMYELNYEGNSYKRKDFVENEAMKFLETMKKIGDAINHPNILTRMNKPSFKFTWASLSPVITFVDKNTKFYKIPTKKNFNVTLAELDIVDLKFFGYYRGEKR
ncbi:hypothetical protein I6G82_11030 [Lysinibacillus macroides]|uniref:Uncharacterized protein n=1 Tax=Lysinibacillus macroides TaxID=33935 RepID=A0A0M9DLJ5_9BACI|nr:hypothetical protein [Lysinibacillus macroides]KOY83083.1 hypothetical protein ADM90_07235 [Lysinibacillus macroides]QPR70060.1 hypothetical protein I6G82_11030 [Lysinibacillus macroides]